MTPRNVNYIPRPDADFDAWLAQYYTASVDWWDLHGGDGLLDDLVALMSDWRSAYAAHVAAQAAATARAEAKNEARRLCEAEVRRLTRIVQGASDTTDAQRAAMGISLRPTLPGAPTPPPATRPVVRVDHSLRLRHTIKFSDESMPTRKARPRGTIGAEVRLRLVPAGQPAPSDPETFRFLTLATDSQTTAEFSAAEGGQTACYQLRWVGPGGVAGPWSEVTSATIAA